MNSLFTRISLGLASCFILVSCSFRNDSVGEDPALLTEKAITGTSVATVTGSDQIRAKNTAVITNTLYIPGKIGTTPILINDIQNNRTYLMTRSGTILHEWNLSGSKLGNDATLLSDGGLLVSLKIEKPITPLGGVGGILARLDQDGDIVWKYDTSLAGTGTVGHHDLLELENGNILALIWEKIPAVKVKEYGYKLENNIFPEKIIEINPMTNTIVWEWRSLDHIVQDVSKDIRNYARPSARPERIDINYMQSVSGAVMHANGLAYDEKNKLIFLSVNNFSEVWVIDHSTTTLEARGSTGGKYARGGDLVYRFGNPAPYGAKGERLFHNNHHPNFTNSGTLMIFSNGNGTSPLQSTVYELELPKELSEGKIPKNPPKVLWSYSHPDLFFDKISGATRLDNGNTLITEGDGHLWEVSPEKEIVWKYSQSGSLFWRSYSYSFNHPGIQALGIKRE